MGLTSVIGLPADQLPGEALERVFKATLDLLVAYKEQVAGVPLSLLVLSSSVFCSIKNFPKKNYNSFHEC